MAIPSPGRALKKVMRANRFPLQLPVRFRPVGASDWRHGKTENVSASGVLLHVRDPPQVDTTVEFSLTLDAAKPGGRGEVAGRGRVVRVIGAPERPERSFAIAIEQYNFRPESSPARFQIRLQLATRDDKR